VEEIAKFSLIAKGRKVRFTFTMISLTGWVGQDGCREMIFAGGSSTMLKKTIIVVGPGGVGKSPLDVIFKVDTRIEPYRLRGDGPRASDDVFYAHPKLYQELTSALKILGDERQPPEPQELKPPHEIEWYERSKTLFFNVRQEKQSLLLAGLKNRTAKAEIYAPVLCEILDGGIPGLKGIFGRMHIVVLNPASGSVLEENALTAIQEKTACNCKARGDSDESVRRRCHSVGEELDAWKRLIQQHDATEYADWEYPEYLYNERGSARTLLEHRIDLLCRAKKCLLAGDPELKGLVKSDKAIRADVLLKARGSLLKERPELEVLLRSEEDILAKPPSAKS
jgi:hypothetical protein